MLEIKKGSLEERALKILLKKYPITVTELRTELGISKSSIERLVKGLIARKIIKLDTLPDKEFILLIRRDFRFIGHHSSQRKPLKLIKRRDRAAKLRAKTRGKKKDDYDHMMYQ
jgi:DNA-binding transcriptional regulator GbsR (MarR family)